MNQEHLLSQNIMYRLFHGFLSVETFALQNASLHSYSSLWNSQRHHLQKKKKKKMVMKMERAKREKKNWNQLEERLEL